MYGFTVRGLPGGFKASKEGINTRDIKRDRMGALFSNGSCIITGGWSINDSCIIIGIMGGLLVVRRIFQVCIWSCKVTI
jgi:hypothetical protein